jgi:hypoxanthine-guanine phosphoribosyltransferase
MPADCGPLRTLQKKAKILLLPDVVDSGVSYNKVRKYLHVNNKYYTGGGTK